MWIKLPYARPRPFDTFTVSDDLSMYYLNGGYCALADATSGNITLSLPPATGCDGFDIVVKKIDSSANAVTIDVAETDGTIDGQASIVIDAQYDSYSFVCDGSNWWII
jgi:hypothetical protein